MRTKHIKIAIRVVLAYSVINEHPYSLLFSAIGEKDEGNFSFLLHHPLNLLKKKSGQEMPHLL